MTADVRLPRAFYEGDDVVAISQALLGKVLCTKKGRTLTRAVISETEAYAGIGDRASHAYGDRRTKRTEPMYGPGGTAYVYLCYGIHHLFNVVTNQEGTPHAVLVRAGVPLTGVVAMSRRRGCGQDDPRLLSGPGSLAKAMGITTELTGADLRGSHVWLEDRGIVVPKDTVVAGPRVGVDYAGEDALLPYRFRVDAGSFSDLAGAT